MAGNPQMIKRNNLLDLIAEDRVCTAFGVKLISHPSIAHLAKTAGYDTLFIDHEHSQLSISDAASICAVALSSGITPFVRVPYQCGDGYVQKMLDAGAMGIVFPHINTADDARAAVKITKYPPMGSRSWTNGLAQFEFVLPPPQVQVEELNRVGSMVILQIESVEGLRNVEEIAAVDGVDVLLVGTNDLALEMGMLGDWDNEEFLKALQRVGEACRKKGKVFGIAGIYTRPDLMDRVVNEMGVRYVLGAVDVGLLSAAMKQNCGALKSAQR